MARLSSERVQATVYARVKGLLSVERWGSCALPRLTLDQLRLLTETLMDTYCAGFLAGQVQERIASKTRAAEEFFALLRPDAPLQGEERAPSTATDGHDGGFPHHW